MADLARRIPRWMAGFVAALALLAALSEAHNPLTAQARAYAQDIATASAATYVSLRTLNAFLSVAQEI